MMFGHLPPKLELNRAPSLIHIEPVYCIFVCIFKRLHPKISEKRVFVIYELTILLSFAPSFWVGDLSGLLLGL